MQLEIKLLFEKPAIAYMTGLLFLITPALAKGSHTNIGVGTFYIDSNKLFKTQSN